MELLILEALGVGVGGLWSGTHKDWLGKLVVLIFALVAAGIVHIVVNALLH